jgi:hypothetical protein
MTLKASSFASCPQDLIGYITCSLRIYFQFTKRDVVTRNSPFVPVLLFISHCSTTTSDNDQAVKRQAHPALSLLKKHALYSTPASLQTSLTFGWQKRLSVLGIQTKTWGGLMKDISTILLTSAFVLFSLLVLISAARTPDRTTEMLHDDQQRISDLGLRFTFKR